MDVGYAVTYLDGSVDVVIGMVYELQYPKWISNKVQF